MDNNGKELLRRGKKLFETRDNIIQLWQEIGDNFYPERADFTTERMSSRLGFADHLFATDPVLMRRDLGNAFSSMLRPRGRLWFELDVEDEALKEAAGVSTWLDNASNVMRRAIYDRRAQFVRATKEGDHDFAAFGNAVITVEVNQAGDALRYRNWHLRDCAWVENHAGMVDTMFRKVPMTARQMKQFFTAPGDNLHRDVFKACEKEPDKEMSVKHIMLPTEDYEYATRKRKPKQAFVSVYIDCDHEEVIREAPAFEFRYVVPRWSTLSGSQYGLSPAAVAALPDARMLQALARIIQEAGEKSVDPPLRATEESVRGEINLYAGGVTWVDREYDERLGPALEPIQLGKDAALGVNLLDRITFVLQNAWYINKLTLPQQGEKTAFETAQLVEEFIRAAVPLFEPAETEYNAPLLDLSAAVLQRMGAFGRPEDLPDALSGRELTFSFQNPLQDAVEKAKVLQFQTATGLVGMAVELDPAASVQMDIPKAVRDAVRGSGAPADWLKDEKQAEQEVEEMRQKQQIAEATLAAGGGGEAMEAVGKGMEAMSPQPQQKPKRAA